MLCNCHGHDTVTADWDDISYWNNYYGDLGNLGDFPWFKKHGSIPKSSIEKKGFHLWNPPDIGAHPSYESSKYSHDIPWTLNKSHQIPIVDSPEFSQVISSNVVLRGVKQRGVLLPGRCGRRLAGQIFRRNFLVTVVAGTPKRKGWRKIHYVTMLLQCYEFCNLSVLGLGCYERHFYYGNMVGVWWFTWDYYSMNTLWWWAGHFI